MIQYKTVTYQLLTQQVGGPSTVELEVEVEVDEEEEKRKRSR